MSAEKRRRFTVEEAMRVMKDDPEFQRHQRAWEEATAAQREEARRAVAPILADLRGVGIDIEGLGELWQSPEEEYRRAVPTLLTWLQRTSDTRLKEGIARTLTSKWAKPIAAHRLIEEFKTATDFKLKWTIGNAIDVVADERFTPELLELSADRRHGRGRQMIVNHLAKAKDPQAVDVLMDLLDDDDVLLHAVYALGALKVTKAKPRLRRLLNHPFAYVEAKKALAKIERAERKAAEKGKGP